MHQNLLQMSDLIQIGTSIAGTLVVVGGFLAAWQKVLSAKDEKLEASKAEMISVLETSKSAWKEKWEIEHEEYKCYREHTHEQINTANSKILTITEENAHLKIKTDMTPVLETLDKMVKILNAMMERLNIPD